MKQDDYKTQKQHFRNISNLIFIYFFKNHGRDHSYLTAGGGKYFDFWLSKNKYPAP